MKLASLQHIARHKIFKSALFILVLLATSYYYNYQDIISYRPTSIHQWRNSVSASIALNYFHEGEFLHPRTNNMQVDNFSSDITITEFPIIYYFIAILYKIFGFHEYIFKLVNVIIGFTGLYFLFQLGLRSLKNTFYALLLPLVLFTSPIYVYYTNNFIPDASSLSIGIIGLFFFYNFYLNGRYRDLYISLAFLCLAGLLKTPALLLYFAFAGLFVIELILKFKLKGQDLLFMRRPGSIMAFSSVIILIIAWYSYAKIYTDVHGGVVSLVEIRPIWVLSGEYISEIWVAITERFWKGIYHSPVLLILAFFLLLHNIIFWRKYNRMISMLVLLTLFGGICFTLLFYRSMKQHDYYQLNNLVVPLLIIMNFLLYLKNNRSKLFNSWISKSVLAGFMLILVYSSNRILHGHYYDSWIHNYTEENYNKNYDEITPYLRSLGIERSDKIYCSYDPSINISLYLMDQKGFTDFTRTKELFSDKVSLFRSHGCKYVIISDYTKVDRPPEDLGLEKIGSYRELGIYRFN